MDETVKQAMAKWPNVPNVHGWLRLDRRGRWCLQVRPGVFEPIGNSGLVEFIGRNYQMDDERRWFFQNGPQRVFVGLDYTAWIYRLEDCGEDWLTQCGTPAGAPSELLVDENDDVLLVTGLGPGLVLDRDLPALLDGLADEAGSAIDAEVLLAELHSGGTAGARKLRLLGAPVSASMTHRAAIMRRFGLVTDPQPATGNTAGPQDALITN